MAAAQPPRARAAAAEPAGVPGRLAEPERLGVRALLEAQAVREPPVRPGERAVRVTGPRRPSRRAATGQRGLGLLRSRYVSDLRRRCERDFGARSRRAVHSWPDGTEPRAAWPSAVSDNLNGLRFSRCLRGRARWRHGGHRRTSGRQGWWYRGPGWQGW